ncbi:unnamed protein product [Caenorhabditis bovis]|uniref:Uncharacterized protein n=1 Tax=Caenorhabditis bovis TaxID=2654633 RepID=A0A8S1EPX0_9PELO|nr:unnamed protein product [Caenorhabditis bovis]
MSVDTSRISERGSATKVVSKFGHPSLISPTSEKTPGLKRKRSSISGRLFKKHEADENLDESGGEEEAEERGFAISKPSTSHGEAGNDAGKQLKINSISSRKGEYFVKNADGIPTEKFSMRYRNLLHSGEDPDDDSGDEMPPGVHAQIALNDRWKPEYNDGVQMLVNPDGLPKFEIIDMHIELKRKSPFSVPNKLITVEPCSSSETHEQFCISAQRLYQGDALDEAFLKLLNAKRARNGVDQPYLKSSTFLDIMNHLEISSFRHIHETLLKPLHSPSTRLINDDEDCDICRIAECDVDDEMVFCDGCNVCVHMSCYGLTTLPEGEWLCLKCTLCNGVNPPCVLCPTIGGAMKCTKHKERWAHIVCALWLPECRFGDIEKREPIMEIEEIPEERWHLKCSVCDTRQGACIQCTHPGCKTAFHVTCALRSGFTMKIEQDTTDPNQDRVAMISLCKKHTSASMSSSKSDESSPTESNEQLRRLEKFFYVYADFEEIAKTMCLPSIVVSDVYEYWKQKRGSLDGKPLIVDPQDNILISPETVNLCLPSVPGVTINKSQLQVGFIDPRRKWEKKIREGFDKDSNLCSMLINREKQKKKIVLGEHAILNEFWDFTTKNVVSARAADGLLELLENLMHAEDVREAKRIGSRPDYVSSTKKRLELIREATLERDYEPPILDLKPAVKPGRGRKKRMPTTVTPTQNVIYKPLKKRISAENADVVLKTPPKKRGRPFGWRKVKTGAKCPRVHIVTEN